MVMNDIVKIGNRRSHTEAAVTCLVGYGNTTRNILYRRKKHPEYGLVKIRPK